MRLLEIVVPGERRETAESILEEAATVYHWSEPLSGDRVLLAALVTKENVETLMDSLESQFGSAEGFRLVLLPVEATLPREEEPKEEPKEESEEDEAAQEAQSKRISREELYADVESACVLSWNFVALVVLSTVVAAFGLMRDNPAVIIGAMVMAPLLGPNVGLALASTLGDGKLAWRAAQSNAAGAGIAFVVAVLIGLLVTVEPGTKEVAIRTVVSEVDIAVALAAGIAGSLAFTSGMSASIIGVMVAVALLPPLVVCGLLVGGRDWPEAYRAFVLVLVNISAVNLAGVGTFLVQGIRPATWWEKEQARKTTFIAAGIWLAVLVALIVLIAFVA